MPRAAVISNAANNQRVKAEDVAGEDKDDPIAVNVKHELFCAQAVLDMIATGTGSIVNIGLLACATGFAEVAPYFWAKSGVSGSRTGSPSTTVQMGWACTGKAGLNHEQARAGRPGRRGRACAEQNRPRGLRRSLQPFEVAKMILFHVSDEASACTRRSELIDSAWV